MSFQHAHLLALAREQCSRRLEAAQVRHADVHKDDAGPEPSRRVHCFAPVTSFADDVDLGAGLEDLPKPLDVPS